MQLPVMPPVEPMLANAVPKIPTADGMRYEPKWDGFRTIIFRDGDEVELVSRGGKTMTRYFPEVVAQVRAQLPPRCVIDGEVVLVRRPADQSPRLDFESLQQRIHPAASRVNMLAETTPCDFVAFDLLALGDRDLMGEAVRAAARGAGDGPGRGRAAGARHADHDRPGRGGPVVRDLRRGRAGRADRQAGRHRLRAGQATHVQDQTCPYGGLRGGRVPVPQDRRGGRIAAAGAVRRGGPAAPRRGERVVHRRAPQGAADRAGAVPDRRGQGPPVDGLARRRRIRRGRAAHPGWRQPVDRHQGPQLAAAAGGAGGRGRLRRDGGRPVPAHRPVQTVATRPHAGFMYLRAAGAPAAGSTSIRCSRATP